MSPVSTLKSCGNSSIDQRRRNRPIGVTRGSSRILKIAPAFSLLDSSVSWRSSASAYIVRNLKQANGTPPIPGRTER